MTKWVYWSAGVIFVVPFLAVTLWLIKGGELDFWFGRAFVLTVFMVISTLTLIFLGKGVEKYRDWRYPDYHRELSSFDKQFLETETRKLSEYIESRNFGSKKYWPVAWLIFCLWLPLTGLLGIAGFFVIDYFSEDVIHGEFGALIGHNGPIWMLILAIFLVITALAALAWWLVGQMFRPFRLLFEPYAISSDINNADLQTKANKLLGVLEDYVRKGVLPTTEHKTGEEHLHFIGLQRMKIFLISGLVLGLIACPALILERTNGVSYYETGLASRPILSQPSETDYADLDHVNISCLFDPSEKDFSTRDYHFYKDNTEVGHIRIPTEPEDAFENLHNYLMRNNVPFKKAIYEFRGQDNIDEPFDACLTELFIRKGEQKEWLRKVMRLDQFESGSE